MPALLCCTYGLVTETDHNSAGNACFRKGQASYAEGKLPAEEWEEALFVDRTLWRDKRQSNLPLRHLNFEHKKFEVALWLDYRPNPALLDSQLGTWDAGTKEHSESVIHGRGAFGVAAADEDHLGIGMCRKVCEDGRIADAVDALNLLVQRRCCVDRYLFYSVLKRCITDKDLVLGRRIHALTVDSGYEGDGFLATHLIRLYASNGKLEEATEVFTNVPTPDAYNWATIILAYARHEEAAEAIHLFRRMQESTTIKATDCVYVAVLKACAAAQDLASGKDVHAHMLACSVKPNIIVQNCLINMYAKCGSLEDARKVFDALPERNVVTWNALLAGYAQQGQGQEVLSLYCSMQQEGLTPPSSVTYVSLLQACSSVGVGALLLGKQLHAEIKKRGLIYDMVLGSSLVTMYAKCGSLEDARNLFDKLPERDVVTWTAMIAGYAQQGMGQEALSLYSSMQQEGLVPPNSVSYVCLLQACASVGVQGLDQGQHLHAQIEERGLQDDVVLGGSLVNMYAKCGSLDDARMLFNRLRARNVVSWTAMITGYAQQGMGEEALNLYNSMKQEGITPLDSVSYACLLQACAIVAALPLGRQLHAEMKEHVLQDDAVVGAALVNMYAKCGSMVESQQVFDSLPERSIEAWGALIAGNAFQGDSDIVFHLLNRMTQEGVQPNGIVFLSVLTVCSHVGLIDKGRKYFEAMCTDYAISPTIEHYICMMDLLGRAGHVDEALQMARGMPFASNNTVWHMLLGACRKWNNVEIAQQAFESAVSLDGGDAASYVLMSNIYSSNRMWGAAKELQAMRVESEA